MILFLKHTIETSFDFSQCLMLFLNKRPMGPSGELKILQNVTMRAIVLKVLEIDTNVKALSKKL